MELKEKITAILEQTLDEVLDKNNKKEGANNSVFIFGKAKAEGYVQFLQCAVAKKQEDGRQFIHSIPTAPNEKLLTENADIDAILNKNLNMFEKGALKFIDLQDEFNKRLYEYSRNWASEHNIPEKDVCFVVKKGKHGYDVFPFIEKERKYMEGAKLSDLVKF